MASGIEFNFIAPPLFEVRPNGLKRFLACGLVPLPLSVKAILLLIPAFAARCLISSMVSKTHTATAYSLFVEAFT
jgi:hypothetical protein